MTRDHKQAWAGSFSKAYKKRGLGFTSTVESVVLMTIDVFAIVDDL